MSEIMTDIHHCAHVRMTYLASPGKHFLGVDLALHLPTLLPAQEGPVLEPASGRGHKVIP